MAKKRQTDTPRRGEITEKIDKSKDEMAEKTEKLDTVAADGETVVDTLEGLDLDGTAEAMDQVEATIEQAQDTTQDVFQREDDDLGEMLTDVEEYEDELQERSDASEADLDKVSDTTEQIATEETKRELEQAKAEIDDDLEFLREQGDTARQAREENERLRQEYQGRMQGTRR